MDNNNLDVLRRVRAVLFDLDGVLVDTAVYHYEAWKRIAEELGFNFTHAHNEELKGVSRIESLNKILHWANAEKSLQEIDELLVRKNTWYLEYIKQLDVDSLLPGTLDFLKQLKQDGIRIGLGSASKNAPLILEQTGISPYFDAIVDGNIVTTSKPDPEVFLKGSDLLGVPPVACLVLEDAQAGVDAAKAAGMYVIGVSGEENLRGVDGKIADLSELLMNGIRN